MPVGQPPLDLFVGREAEVARVAEVVARVEAGQPWLVAIEGDPGMGKTALARRCLTGAAGLRVLSARADQVEADLDFGVVGQLLFISRKAVEYHLGNIYAKCGLQGRQQLRRFVGV